MKHLFVVTTVLGIFLTATVNAFASDVTNQTLGKDTTSANTEINVSGGESSFEYTLPKTIAVAADNNARIFFTYDVTIWGNLAGNDYVSIIPDSSFYLNQSGKLAITAEVTQVKTKFRDGKYIPTLSAEEALVNTEENKDNVVTTGTITANNVTAGIWSGTLNFNVTLEDDRFDNAGLYDANGNRLAVLTAEQVNSKTGNTSLAASVGVDASNVYSAILPKGVTKVPSFAFYNCSNLRSVCIPKSVTTIENAAFAFCGLNSITIPKSITSIGDSVFTGCTRLMSIIIPDSVTAIGSGAFSDCTNLTSVELPDNIISIGDYTFDTCTNLTSIGIPDSVTKIGICAFYGCKGLTSIEIPDRVTSIGYGAFSDCTGLVSIIIPNGVTTLEKYTFYKCTNLASVTIPNSVTSIKEQVFQDCTSLTSVTIPDGVTSIGDYAFHNVPHVIYHGTATGSPWGAKSIN